MRLLLALLTLLLFLPMAAYGHSPGARLDAKQLAKAESLINQLEQLDNLISSGPLTAKYKARIAKVSDSFSGAAGSLPEVGLKTDMATALYWYEQMARSLNHAAASKSGAASVEERCGYERPGAYQKLCESTSGSARDLLWAKARLHMNWARAGINFQRTGKVDRPLDDVAFERKLDEMLAARIIESLKTLESEVIVYRSLGDFEASGKLARVPFAAFKEHLQKISAEAEGALSWLPQNRLKNEIGNALHSFQDGAFWWEQIDQPRVVNVSDLAARDLNRSPSDAVLMTTVPYTIAINWRHGSRYLKRAEQMMNQ